LLREHRLHQRGSQVIADLAGFVLQLREPCLLNRLLAVGSQLLPILPHQFLKPLPKC
jgi:hypothetical protein